MQQLFRVFTILTPQDVRRCAGLCFCMFIGAVLEAIGIGLVLPLISVMGDADFFVRHENMLGWLKTMGISSHDNFIVFCAGSMTVFYVVKNVYLAWQMRLQLSFVLRRQTYYACQLYALYLQRPYLYHLNHNSSTLLRNAYDGPRSIFSTLLMAEMGLITEGITATVIWGMLIVVDAFTATIVAGGLGILMYAGVQGCRRTIGKHGGLQSKAVASIYQWVNQGLGSIKETKVFQKEAYFYEAYQKSYQQFDSAFFVFSFISQVPRFMIETIVVTGLLFLIIAKILLGNSANEVMALLGVLALAAFRLMPCANRILSYITTIKFNMPMLNELYEDLVEIRKKRMEGIDNIYFQKSVAPIPFTKELSIVHLGFHYPGVAQHVLTDVSVTIPKGSFVGIIGPSGAGKTTFVDLLLGLLEPETGDIMVDGVSIYQKIRAWQANLAYVPQNIYIIDGTLRDNIALGLPEGEIDDTQIEKVLYMAELHELVESFPQGVYTMVGERGVKLSGGQRQRIGIARALYCNPTVLVLDEATSALDNVTERSITETILKLKGRITIISIAHRVSTLEECDFKIKFDNGYATRMT